MKVPKKAGLKEVDNLEIISLVDNTVDFLSPISHKNAHPFVEWMRKKCGQDWLRSNTKYPLAEHGFSMLLRVSRKNKSNSILFDTGGSAKIILENARRMELNLSEVGCIVLSHGHYDHFGGLISAVKAIGKADLPVYVHEDMYRIRGNAYSMEQFGNTPSSRLKKSCPRREQSGQSTPCLSLTAWFA